MTSEAPQEVPPEEQNANETEQEMLISDEIPDPDSIKEEPQAVTNPDTAPDIDKLRVPTAERETREDPEQSIESDTEDDYRIKADYSTKPGEISIDNYDRYKVTQFTDNGTINALKNLGINATELFMPSEQEIAKYEHDNDFKEVFVNHHYSRISRLVTLVQRERHRFLDREANKNLSVIESDTTAKPAGGAVEMEELQLEKIKMRQKREVEKMIESLLALDKFQKEMAAAEKAELEKRKKLDEERKAKREADHKRHLEHLKEMEKAEKKRLKEEEEMRIQQFERDKKALEQQKKLAEEKLALAKEQEEQRRQRMQQNLQTLEKIENERQKRIAEQERLIQEREVKRLQAQQEEQERLNKEKQAQLEKRLNQIKQAREFEQKQAEKKRKEAEEREKRHEDKIKALEERRHQEIKAFADQTAERIKRNYEVRIQISKDREKMIKEKAESDEDVKRRLENIEKMRQEKAMKARLSRSDGAIQKKKRAEEYKKKQLQKQMEMDEAFKRSEMKLQEAKEARERQQKLRNLQYQLKQEEQKQNIIHRQRQDQIKKQEMTQKMEARDEKIARIQKEKLDLQKERSKRVQKLQFEKRDLSEKMRTFQVKCSVDGYSIQALAKKYDIDFESLKAKYEPRASSMIQESHLPPLNP